MALEKKVLDYYSREDVREAMTKAAFKREVAGVYPTGGYSSRPDMINYPNDILRMVKEGVQEFHCSIERWVNPGSIMPENYSSLRDGWDIILDLDCKDTEHGKEAAKALLWALRKHGLENVSIKFTGGTGFHMGIPWEAFPKEINFEPIAKDFPKIPRHIANYLRDFTRDKLIENLEKRWSWEEMANIAGVKLDDVVYEDGFINPWKIVDIDPVLISTRHLFRMPYSMNKKSFLVSVPFDIDKIDEFEREWAKSENVNTDLGFLDKWKENEAEVLFFEALKWAEKNREEERKERRPVNIEITSAVPEDFFPSCIKNILKGLSDGRKRAMFIITSFLRSVKWEWNDIEMRLLEWNDLNQPPLPRNTIMTHIRNHRRKPDVLPPNCDKDGWYIDVGACEPSECKKYRNPATYVLRTYSEKDNKKKRRKSRKKKENIIDNSVIPKDAYS